MAKNEMKMLYKLELPTLQEEKEKTQFLFLMGNGNVDWNCRERERERGERENLAKSQRDGWRYLVKKLGKPGELGTEPKGLANGGSARESTNM